MRVELHRHIRTADASARGIGLKPRQVQTEIGDQPLHSPNPCVVARFRRGQHCHLSLLDAVELLATGPVLVLVEDGHWADPTTVEWVVRLSERHVPGVAVVISSRPADLSRWGSAEVLAIEPGRALSYTWDFVNDDPAYALKSVVTFTLTPTATGTHLRMEQAGFRPNQKQAFGGAKIGWQQFFTKLDDVAARA